uniref:Uncharacterized protein n=1 Tax=Vespula pensylvanica TaxID=30213 RepID=A0A834P2G6_VESPE|nr:hypothetical protein H0235_008129 [Vespula pensylvanica]
MQKLREHKKQPLRAGSIEEGGWGGKILGSWSVGGEEQRSSNGGSNLRQEAWSASYSHPQGFHGEATLIVDVGGRAPWTTTTTTTCMEDIVRRR